MVFTIHRYIFRDLIKMFLLSTVAMTVIMSLGSILAPIQKFGVGPKQVLSLLRYSIPVSLTYVLPMAALFATSLTYGRFASDNELDACRASGISKLTIIYPALCLGLAIAIANLLLSFYVVPTYVSKAERSIRANAKQIVFKNIQRQGYYNIEGSRFTLIADEAVPSKNLLIGVNVIETDEQKPVSLTSCDQAYVEFDTHKNYNDVTIVAKNAFQLDQQGQAYSQELPIKAKLPSLLEDNINFQKLEGLKEIRLNPLKFEPTRKRAYNAYNQMILEMLAQDINEKDGKLYQMKNEDFAILISGDKVVTKNGKVALRNNVELYEYSLNKEGRADKLIRKWNCKSADIKIEANTSTAQLYITLEGASWKSNSGYSGVPTKYSVHNLKLPRNIANKLSGTNIIEAINKNAKLIKNPSTSLTTMIYYLQREILLTNADIDTEIQSRLVFGIGCIVIVLMSAAFGIFNKGGHPLAGFGLSSIPAAALIIFMTMGKNITNNAAHQRGAVEVDSNGIMIMWLGLTLLSIACFWMYRKLLKT